MKFALILILSILGLPQASAAEYEYKCFSYYWNGYENESGTMELSIDSRSAHADILEVEWDEEMRLGGAIDKNYKSRGRIEYVRYGRRLIVEKVMLRGGKRLLDGDFGGFVRVEGEAEGGFYQYRFVCRR